MGKKKRTFLTGFMGVFLLFFVVSLYQTKEQKEEEPGRVSVILYGNTMDRWESLKQGLDQASREFDIETNYVLMSVMHDKEEQLQLIQREIDGGAEGILLAASDSKIDLSTIRMPSEPVPVVCIESGIEDQNVTLVSGDNYRMGEELAEAVEEKENDIAKIAVIMDQQQRDSVKERYQGFYNKITDKFDRLTFWEREKGEDRPMLFVQRELTEEAVDVVVALDNTSLEAVIDAVNNLNKKVKIYGIANSDKTVYYLDTGKIKTLLYQDEFNIGYIGMEILLGKKSYEKEQLSSYIHYYVVEDKNLYSPEHQRVLFPFVK